MQYFEPFLHWIDTQKEQMTTLVEKWANINSGSYHVRGLDKQLQALKESFQALHADIQEVPLEGHKHFDDTGKPIVDPLGKALLITKRKDAKTKILLAGHMDTVFSASSPFQTTTRIDQNTLMGPGVCDMKGGLVVLLYALLAFEKSPNAKEIGWQVLITPDEEIGSPGSKRLWKEISSQHSFALLFEPAFHDGSIVSERGGSANYFVLIKGKSAHSGRDFASGRSALSCAASIIQELESINIPITNDEQVLDHIINVGQLHSGIGYNIVPDTAICKMNIRASTKERMQAMKAHLDELIEKHKKRDGITIELQEISYRPPKVFDEKTEKLFSSLASCAELLGFKLNAKPTRGVSDGNLLAESGLANLDSLGAIGGKMHTTSEYVLLDSLVSRAKLTALFLLKYATGDFEQKKQPPIAL